MKTKPALVNVASLSRQQLTALIEMFHTTRDERLTEINSENHVVHFRAKEYVRDCEAQVKTIREYLGTA